MSTNPKNLGDFRSLPFPYLWQWARKCGCFPHLVTCVGHCGHQFQDRAMCDGDLAWSVWPTAADRLADKQIDKGEQTFSRP